MKNRRIVVTEDGSTSIIVPELGEHYHSHFGAVQESQHVFIDSALAQKKGEQLNVLEFGLGTALNAILSYVYSEHNNLKLNYLAIEKYPLIANEYEALDFGNTAYNQISNIIHKLEWEKWHVLSPEFVIKKVQLDFREFCQTDLLFDLVYFDAFAPNVQTHLWSIEIFREIFNSMTEGGILSTYTVKGSVRRMLKEVGFEVVKIPGPIGKREITRATKPYL